jgi:glycine/D-amino acid oxidase-like deaminating enzyme/nitrite reductase/ring-hydroxylating ferredoxin subunit
MAVTERESWWVASTSTTAHPPLPREGVDADVAVLGGGIAGLTTAYALAREGRRNVVVIEGGRIVEGVTGYTTAKVTVAHNLVYADLRDRFDMETAKGYAESQSAALQWVRDTVAREGIDCELEDRPSLVYTELADDRDKVEAEVDAARQCGLDVELVTDSDLPYDIVAGVRLGAQAQFHPRKYLLALSERFLGRGSRIYEQTRALDVSEGEPCVVETDRGEVRAKEVVVATHYPFLDRGLLFSRLAPYREVVVTVAVPEEQAPEVMAISTGSEEGGTHSVRSTPYDDGRRLLVITGGQYKTGTTSAVKGRYAELTEWVRERFGTGQVEHRWSTQDTSSVDRLPYIGRLPLSGEHVWVATGFSAWGMTGGTTAGMILTDLLQGRQNVWGHLYDPGRVDVKPSAAKFAKENIGVAKELAKGFLKSDLGSPEDLQPGEAGVFLGRHGRTAAYRDEDGALHAASGRCTHLGCSVRFNDAERSWDCPCHGSRFSLQGAVLQGPAVEPLEQREI